MTFNGPPKASNNTEVVGGTPEYWKENKPFKSPKKYFELQLAFARKVAERKHLTILDAVDTYAPVIRNTTRLLGAQRQVGERLPGITDDTLLEEAWATSKERQKEHSKERTEYHPEDSTRFGCSSYDYDMGTKTVNVHFSNTEFEEDFQDGKDVSTGPLDKEKLDRRKSELKQMFLDIRSKYPDAVKVHGRSWLYNLPAYCRLYPDSYLVGAKDYDAELWSHGTSIWGQFLGGNDKEPGEYGFKEDTAKTFLERVDSVPVDRLADALPYAPRNAEGDIQDFYSFYGIE